MPVRFLSPSLGGYSGFVEARHWEVGAAFRRLSADQWFVGSAVRESAAPFGQPLLLGIYSWTRHDIRRDGSRQRHHDASVLARDPLPLLRRREEAYGRSRGTGRHQRNREHLAAAPGVCSLPAIWPWGWRENGERQ